MMLVKSILRPEIVCGHSQKRTFYRMLNAVFNRPDRERIKEVGAERACAEWLMRCGASVRWKDSNKWHKDYNTLPPAKLHKYVIEEVDAHEAAVMDIGFEHFNSCTHVKKARFYHCPYFEDTALEELHRLKDSLEDLELGSLGDITDHGLFSLSQLHLLKSLLLYDLPAIRDKEGTYKRLCKSLPQCDITYKDLQSNTPKD